MVYSNANSSYHSLQASLQKRFSQGFMFNVNYTFSRAIDTFSDEGLYQIEHDQTRPWLNRALSDFHRKHRLILSWAWELPWKGNRLVEGWQLSGIGTFQSGRPFTVDDVDTLRLENLRRDDDHTAEEVVVAARGPGAERVRGFLSNTDLFGIMMDAYGWR